MREADRIANKHLCTLQPAISKDQTQEMEDNGLTLVIPETFKKSFDPAQQKKIISIKEFIATIKEKEKYVADKKPASLFT